MHPSDLPKYAGGSPIQHQIINGVINSKATLFEVTKEIDSGPILYKTNLSLDFRRRPLASKTIGPDD